MAIDTNTISSELLRSDPKMVVPPTTQDQTPYESIVQGSLTSLPDISKQVETARADSNAMLNNIASLTGDTANKEIFSQAQQDLAGVQDRTKELDALNAQFTDLGAQIKGLGRSNSAVPLKVQQNNLGTGATDAGVAPQTTGMLRENAIKALTLASEADVLGSQITNAESRLTRAKEKAQLAVDLKYKPIEAEITRLKDLLVLNKDYILDPAEKKRTEAMTIALNERERIINEKKVNEKDNTALMINANSQGAPKAIIDQARKMVANGAKASEVASVLGVYAGDYIGTQLKLKEMKLKDLEWKIKNNELLTFQGNALAQNADGSVITGSGSNATDRNVGTIEQIIRRNAKNIPDGAQTQIGTAIGVINSVKELVQANPDGKFVGMYPTAGFVGAITPDALKRDKTIANETALGAIELKVQQWASGASLTEAQTELVQGMVPKKGDTDNVVQQKVKALTDMMNSQVSAQLTSAGIKFRAEPSDYYSDSIATKVRNSKGVGYADRDIVELLLTDPKYGDKVKQAREAGWTDDKIVTYLQTLN